MPTLLDYQQVIKNVYDEPNNRLRVDASTSVTIVGDVSVEIDAASGDNIAIANADGSKIVTITTIGGIEALDVNIANASPIDVNLVTITPLNVILISASDDIKNQAAVITDTPVQILLTGLVNQKSISCRVWGFNDVYFGGNSSVSSSNGYPKLRLEEFIIDVREDGTAEIWAVCDSGKISELRLIGLS